MTSEAKGRSKVVQFEVIKYPGGFGSFVLLDTGEIWERDGRKAWEPMQLPPPCYPPEKHRTETENEK